MQIGLLGKANVGKSTFFSAATNTSVQIGNFPFTTIKPNVGVTHVTTKCVCKEMNLSHDIPACKNGTRYIPVKIIDIAGLVPGAHEGKGLGNQFLDDARQADILIHVIDGSGSTDIQGQPTSLGSHDPKEDVTFVEQEFDKWFLNILDREWSRLIKEVGQKKISLIEGITKRFSGLGAQDFDVQSTLQDANLAGRKPAEWSKDERESFITALRKRIKPIINAANKADLYADTIPKKLDANPCSAETELLLSKAASAKLINYTLGGSSFVITSEISDAQKNALNMAKEVLNKFNSTGIQNILNIAVFEKLKRITVYPVEDEKKLSNKDGVILPDARLLTTGSTAKDLAFTIHQDIGSGFLHGINIKTGQRVGADYTLQDLDVIKIISTKSRG